MKQKIESSVLDPLSFAIVVFEDILFSYSLWVIMIIFNDNEVMITKITDRIGCYV